MLLMTVGVVVMAAGAIIVVIGASFAQRRTFDPRTAFLRLAAGAGVTALGAVVLYVMDYRHETEAYPSVGASTALALAPGLMCVALSMVRERCAQLAVAFAASVAVIVAVSMVVLACEPALIVLLCALALTSGVCAVLALRHRDLPAGPMRILASASAVYAGYCAARALAMVVLGGDAAMMHPLFGSTPSFVVGVGTNTFVVVAIGMILLPTARAARRRSHSLVTLTICDWDLVVAAYGPRRALDLVDDLRAAARERDPFARDIHRGVATGLPSAAQALPRTLAYEYGWRAEEIAFVITDCEPSSSTRDDAGGRLILG